MPEAKGFPSSYPRICDEVQTRKERVAFFFGQCQYPLNTTDIRWRDFFSHNAGGVTLFAGLRQARSILSAYLKAPEITLWAS